MSKYTVSESSWIVGHPAGVGKPPVRMGVRLKILCPHCTQLLHALSLSSSASCSPPAPQQLPALISASSASKAVDLCFGFSSLDLGRETQGRHGSHFIPSSFSQGSQSHSTWCSVPMNNCLICLPSATAVYGRRVGSTPGIVPQLQSMFRPDQIFLI